MAAPDATAPLELAGAAAEPQRRRGTGSLAITVPAGIIVAMLAACFLGPILFSLPKPVGGDILDSNLPMFSAGHVFGTDQVGNDELSRLLRADILEQMQSQDYVTTAKAKGLGPWHVLVRHAFRNSLFGLLTIVGLNLGTLIGATVIIEQIFALPGVGRELLQAISNRNIPVIEGIVLVFAVVVVVANLVTDLLYAVLDPRVRHGST